MNALIKILLWVLGFGGRGKMSNFRGMAWECTHSMIPNLELQEVDKSSRHHEHGVNLTHLELKGSCPAAVTGALVHPRSSLSA